MFTTVENKVTKIWFHSVRVHPIHQKHQTYYLNVQILYLVILIKNKEDICSAKCKHTHSSIYNQKVKGCDARAPLWVVRPQPGACALSTRCSHLRERERESCLLGRSLTLKFASHSHTRSAPIGHYSFPLIHGGGKVCPCSSFLLPQSKGW